MVTYSIEAGSASDHVYWMYKDKSVVGVILGGLVPAHLANNVKEVWGSWTEIDQSVHDIS